MLLTGTSADHLDRCRRCVIACDAEHGWGLDATARERYVVALAPLLADAPEERWPEIAAAYHQDHAVVAALANRDHPEHSAGWARWSAQAIAVLRHAGLSASRDLALADEDLAQGALADLAQALSSYRYRSRFSSWAFSVIVRSARRQIRYASARRRSGDTDPLSRLTDAQEPADPLPRHEHAAMARLLAERIAGALGEHPDGRLPRLFQLWAVEERTSAEIGALVKLHESRVRALLKQARELLRGHPELRAWADADAGDLIR